MSEAAVGSNLLALAIESIRQRNLDRAASYCTLALQENRDDAEAMKVLSGVRYMEGRFDEALGLLRRAAALAPDDARVHANMGSLLARLERSEEAIACYRTALGLAPEYAEAHYNLGATLAAADRHEEALASYDRALALVPRHGKALVNRGGSLSALNRHEEAIACYDRVLANDPQFAEAETNRGTALQWLNRVDEALARYDTAIAIRPQDAYAHWNKGLAALYRGDYETGWREYEWRWKKPDFAPNGRDFTEPRWTGEAEIAGKTILLFSEQGLGDTIQFCRYAALVAKLGATVLLEVQPPLKPLLKSLGGVARVFARGEPLPPFDLQCPIMSLPLAFKTDASSIPAEVPYLAPSPEKTALWRARLGPRTKPRIGLAWTGNPTQKNDRNRSTQFARLLPLVRDPRFEFHVLQKDIRETDRAAVASVPELHIHGEALNDFDDTAALVSEMDLTISVCTSIVHLAGALAKPAWAMLTFSPDWRWLMDRADSPWYPSARLFRQRKTGDWDELVARVKAALDERFS